ncbi:aldo/keto reductase [Kushneria indalinina]|uniref:D-threo-aldose 1-dehydrogenase n=1 Tax=Kushneria indalinina DSM 14324 TaxID=1122140 RepID=A0A3D9DTT4_9GAMM|nr:aldo/keto reductase [Kushneria indalinina]REC93824.1 D-threo-aldose 1-dehydrogenase [Kushneria indalinina DSM 14324]
MASRRDFLALSAVAAAAGVAAPRLMAAEKGGDNEQGRRDEALPNNPPLAMDRFPPEHKYGVGGTQMGNMYRVTSNEEARAMLAAAWESGTRYFDTSPWYGLGLSERRMGHFLSDRDPSEYLLSTKVGRLLTPDASVGSVGMWKGNLRTDYRYDYSADGVRRSIEDSLQRMGVSKIDLAYIHDLSPDNEDMGSQWKEYFEIARKGAIPELERLRDEGIIGGWGMGVNEIEPSLAAMDAGNPDVILQATQYTLLNHRDALDRLFPACRKRDVSLVIGAPLGSGFLAGSNHWMYSTDIPDGFAEQRDRISAIAREHGTNLRTAALQFTAAPDVVGATIPGARTAEHARENQASMTVDIPAEFWDALKSEGLIESDAPVPG